MKYKFGEKLREIRERRKFTLKQVALRAGVSESLISQIERNKVSPSIDTLLTISEILDIDFEYLFREYKKEQLITVIHEEERRQISIGGISYEQLSIIHDKDEEHAIEAFMISINPGEMRGEKHYGHRGKELGVILEGTGRLHYGNRVYELKQGDSVSFSSISPHTLINTGTEVLRAFWVATPPRMEFVEG
ncbi:MAG: cupin domain-containing protein [Spirochaetales bacterium]|nr:cupin domain-containing protein [Spirochaetales bacterium]